MTDTNNSIVTPRAHDRFKDAPWYGAESITVLGQGGIGSWLTLLLARAGHDLYTYDFDKVEEHNLGGQLFSYNSIGKAKTVAVSDICHLLAENIPNTFGRFDNDSMLTNITMVGPDKMEPRQIAFKKWVKSFGSFRNAIFIDGRLEAETMQIYAVTAKNIEEYRTKALFPDSDVPDAPCTFRASSHSAAIIAGLMVAILNNYLANLKDGDFREVPFMTTLELPTLSFEAK